MIHREISDRKFQMDSLDGLRGFAVLIVVLSHTSNYGLFFFPYLNFSGIGKSGVYLFFLLSSFLLTLQLLDKGKQIFTLPVMLHYWQRRVLRIYPLYTIYLAVGLLSTWGITVFFGKHGVGIPFSLDWQGFFQQMFLSAGKGVTWSIAVEFKFYFVLPIFVFVIVLIEKYGLFVTTLFFLLILSMTQVISPQSASEVNDIRLLPYMPIFVLGVFLAVIQNYMQRRQVNKAFEKIMKYLGYLGVVGIVVMTPLIYSAIVNPVPSNYFHKQFILYALFWSLVLLSSVNVKGMLQQFFTLPILRFFGALSFSLYLFHPVFIEIILRLKMNSYLSAWIVLLAATLAAYVSFVFLEGPISKYNLLKKNTEGRK
ncbi:acyltransferase [Sulfurimonas sp. HSL1-2]|uniref:acyltransferase family protein n=1 Tax=Thiomicrolovo zhangzhouensis TaxID=3131933 RepID=UPI0031F9D20C